MPWFQLAIQPVTKVVYWVSAAPTMNRYSDSLMTIIPRYAFSFIENIRLYIALPCVGLFFGCFFKLLAVLAV